MQIDVTILAHVLTIAQVPVIIGSVAASAFYLKHNLSRMEHKQDKMEADWKDVVALLAEHKEVLKKLDHLEILAEDHTNRLTQLETVCELRHPTHRGDN
jgi:leucyl aminopeptidase (aminopeptidase T)